MRRGSNLAVAAVLAAGLGALGYFGTRPEATAGQQPVVRPAQPIQPVQPVQPGGVQMSSAGGPKYTVVDTEGTNLLVIDNTKNTLFFYTCDEGKGAGEVLKLRGTIDLNQVGQPTITPKGQPKAEAEPKGDK